MANRHLSYDEFKNIFGDLGVTEWTKYNWLDNNFNLPSNLVRVEYIEFNGTQVIQTDVYSSLTVECKQEAEIAFTDINQATAATGADYGYYFGIADGLFCVAQFSVAVPTKAADTNRHSFINVITPTKQYLYIDGSEHITARTITTENDAFYIGGISNNPTYFAKMKVYSYKLYKDNVLVRNFVPVFDTTTGKYGLYDLVGRQFYGAYIGTLSGPKLFRFTEDNLSNIEYFGLYSGLQTFYINIGDQLVVNDFITETDNSKYKWVDVSAESNFGYRQQNLGGNWNINRCYVFLDAASEEAAWQVLKDNPVVIVFKIS